VAVTPLRLTTQATSTRASRVRTLGWAVALEAALLASLIAAERSDSWLETPLRLLQSPGWVVAWMASFLVGAGTASIIVHAAIAGVVNVPLVYALMRAANRDHGPNERLANLNRPYPNAIPVLILAALVPMYMAIAAGTPGRTLYVPEIALDRALPLRPEWSPVYWSQWVFSFLPVFIVRGVELRRRTVLAYVSIVVAAYVGFLVYPTRAPRTADVIGDDFFAWSLRQLYDFDPPYNCFPSLHVAYSFLAALTAWTVHRGLGLTATVWATLIAISTLYTKQHYVLDVIAGVMLALAAYAVFLYRGSRALVSDDTRALAPRRALTIPSIFAVVVVGFWIAYLGS
jgi:membrane-associated phospholipid phosphatase